MDEFGHFGLFNCKIIVIGFHTPRGSVNRMLTLSLSAHNNAQNKCWLIHLMGSIISFKLTIVEGVHGAYCTVHVKLNLYLTYVAMLNGFSQGVALTVPAQASFLMPKQFTQQKPWEKPMWLKRLKF